MKNHVSSGLMKLSAICLVFAVLLSSSTLVLAVPGAKAMSAEIIVSGGNDSANPAVLLNGERASSGRTFLSSAVIVTSATGSAVVNLGKLGRLTVLPGSALNLSFSENNISGELTAGQVRVFNNEGVSVNIKTTDNVVTNDATQSNSFTVDVRSGSTQAVAETGSAFLNGAPVQDKDDDDDDHKMGIWIPILVFAGIVGTAAAFTLTNGDDETSISGVR